MKESESVVYVKFKTAIDGIYSLVMLTLYWTIYNLASFVYFFFVELRFV